MKKLNFLIFCYFLFTPLTLASALKKDRYELNIGADFPLFTGIQAKYNWNTHYYTKLSAGFALELFMNTNNYLLNELDISENRDFFTSVLTNSIVCDTRIGWSVNTYEGPYVELGYLIMFLGKGEVTGGLINQSIREINKLPNSSIFHINNINHGPSAHLGYKVSISNQISLNVDFGIYKPIFSHTRLDYGEFNSNKAELEKVNSLLTRELWFISLGAWLGIRF